jgi:hypothetical protein
VCVQFVALLTSGDIRLRAKRFAPKDVQSLHSLFVFGPSSCSGLQVLMEGKYRLPQSLTRRIREASDLVVAGDRKRKTAAELSLRQLSDLRTNL